MIVNGKVLAGAFCAAFVGGILLSATVFFVYLHTRRLVSRAQHHEQMPSPPQSQLTPFGLPKAYWWFPQPDGFDLKEHKIVTALESTLAETRCYLVQSDIFSFAYGAQWKELTVCPDSQLVCYRPSPLPARTRRSALVHLLSSFIFPNISLDGSGLAEWNLLSPHLASLAQEIAELQKQRDSTDNFYVWAWEKFRIYALINLYPSIFPTPVLEHQNEQPTTQHGAISRLEKLLVDLLSLYIHITDDEVQALRSMLQAAGRLGVCLHKDLKPWGWSWETREEEGIILFPALQVKGDKSGIRDPSKEACQVIYLQLDRDYNMAGQFLGDRETETPCSRDG